jgi:hypothetical protein
MSVLLAAAVLAAIASVITTGCVAYILLSFRRSGRMFASRIGRQQMVLVLVASEDSRRQQPKRQSVAPPRQLRLQPLTSV